MAHRTPTLSRAVLIVKPRPRATIRTDRPFRVVKINAFFASDYSQTILEFCVSPCITFFHVFCISLLCLSSLGHQCHFPKQLYFHVICNGLSVPPLQLLSNEAWFGPRCASLYQTIFVPRQNWLLGKLKVYPDEIPMAYICLHIRYMVVVQRLGVVP